MKHHVGKQDLRGAESAKRGDIRPPPPLIDFGMIPSLSTPPGGKAALSNFKTSAL
jgi:hypothetical protein